MRNIYKIYLQKIVTLSEIYNVFFARNEIKIQVISTNCSNLLDAGLSSDVAGSTVIKLRAG
jgi:hypothetical protein